jgi:putative ABC transport system permease protein
MLAWKLARRELRGSFASFRVFLACLAIGVAAIAAVGSITGAINAGLAANGRALLGGDVELRLTHRFAEDDERAWLEAEAGALSEVVSFRGMIGAPSGERALSQIKGVDAVYPLVGALELKAGRAKDALAEQDGVFGAVVEQAMMDRLDLSVGDMLRLGTKDVELRGIITSEPDRQASGIGLGPRLMVSRAALEGAGLLQTGSLYRVSYRLALAEGDTAEALQERMEKAFPDAGWRWRDLSDPSPGTSRVVERIGTFLVLVGLASLAVGGVGVSAATRGYLERKTETIGTLKALGASGGLTVAVYLIQIMLLTAVGVAIGLVIGAGVPFLLASTLRDALPVPADFGVYPSALFEAAAYGTMTALLFALWPLAMARETPVAVLFRDVVERGRWLPRPIYLVGLLILFAALVGAAVLFSGNVMLGGFFIGGLVVALVAFALVAQVVRWFARWLGRRPAVTRGRPALRLALSAIGGPGSETTGVMLSLGLGLTLLSTIGQIDANLRGLIAGDISEEAPAFFYLDIPAPQRDAFVVAAEADEAINRIETAPMLRGRIVKINGEAADPEKIDPEARWMLRGDRGLTYSATPPEGTTLTEGAWWGEDYSGEPLLSFIEEEGRAMGLKIGDTITVNVLGRDLTARIANFREVEWRRMGINFTLVVNPTALQGAPHSHIATVYAAEGEEGRLTRLFAEDFPSAVAIPVREVIERTKTLIGKLADAVRGASLATILSGLIVLIGVTAAAQRRHLFEAAVLKTLGAERGMLMRAAVLRYLLLGSAAAVLAIAIGALAAWAVMTKVFEAEFAFAGGSALIVGVLGVVATLVTCGYFARRMVAVMPARMLRARG